MPNHNDNRIENLRILCSICHSQTSTYCTGQRGTYASGARQKIFKYDDDEFKEIIAKFRTYCAVVKLIYKDELLDSSKLKHIRHNYKYDLLKKIKKLDLDISHLKKKKINMFSYKED